MRPGTLTVRVPTRIKKRLDKLATLTGRSRSFLVADAIDHYLDANEWQVAGIRKAMVSLDRGAAVPHQAVKEWVASWDSAEELSRPRSKRAAE